MFLSIGMLKLNYFLADIFILSAEKQPIKLSWRKIECLPIAHLWFVCIHPFDDGNGRIGRAIADMALSQAEDSKMRFFSISHQINKDKNSITTYWRKRRREIVKLLNGLSGILTACSVPSSNPTKHCRRFLTRPYSSKPMPKQSCPNDNVKS